MNDPRLARLLSAPDADREQEIERLIVEIAQPLASAILSRYVRARTALRKQDAEDVEATVNLRLVGKLRALTGSPEDAVQDFEKYVATLTYNAVNDHLRRTFPARARLKNRLRYVLTHDSRLALWSENDTLFAGLAAWRGAINSADERVDEMQLPRTASDREHPADALADLFTTIAAPLSFERLVEITADLWQVVETAAVYEEASDPDPGTAARLERREYLIALWREIRELRPMQRKALLLNLRSGDTPNVASLLMFAGIARFDELAAALEMSEHELAAIWNDLPFDDLRIAAMLNITRQQVINLRKSARDRLSRKMNRTGRPGVILSRSPRLTQ